MKIILIFLVLVHSAFAQRNKIDNAPKVGDPIPKVSAVSLSDKKVVDLSAPKRATVLIFGSHT
ncbi:MAG: hypothetical protein ACSHX6_05895 [Akkermansiaceae bacterium]